MNKAGRNLGRGHRCSAPGKGKDVGVGEGGTSGERGTTGPGWERRGETETERLRLTDIQDDRERQKLAETELEREKRQSRCQRLKQTKNKRKSGVERPNRDNETGT